MLKVIGGFLLGGAYASSIWAASVFWEALNPVKEGGHPFLLVPIMFTVVLVAVFCICAYNKE